MSIIKKIVVTVFSLALFGYAFGATADLEKVRAEVFRKFPGKAVVSVRPTPLAGIFEVMLAPKQIIYTDSAVNFALPGPLIDLVRQVNLTEISLANANRVDFSSLPLHAAIKTVKGNGARKLAVFTDPDCPYCKQLERESLSKIDNITIYTFLYPLDHHADAYRKAALIWCSPGQSKAWHDWMINEKLPPALNTCQTPLDDNIRLGQSLGVHATPTLIFQQGDIVAGVLSSADLTAKIGKL